LRDDGAQHVRGQVCRRAEFWCMTGMKQMRRALQVFLYSLYGLYAVVVCCACLLLGGVIVILLPSLALRRLVARWTLRALFVLAVMPYRIDGLGHLRHAPCIVIANHRTYLDGLALIAALPAHFSAVIKHEMSEVPVIGWFLRHIGCRFVTREPAMAAGRDTRDLLHALKAGESLAIFPEGTFSPDFGLLPFRDGAFFLAAKARVPIVPVVIEGARKILPEGRFLPWPGRLAVRVLGEIEPDGEDRQAAVRLRDQTEAMLSHQLRSRPASVQREKHDYGYYRDVFAGRPLPLAYLDLDLLERDIRSVLERSGSKQLRIDARLLQCPQALQRVMRSHARFHGLKCSTVAEAVRLAQFESLADMLVAYPTLQRGALDQACAAIADGHQITLTVDAPAHLGYLAQAALKGPGRRSAIRSIDTLLQLVEAIDGQANLKFRGVVTYDTQRNHFAEWLEVDRARADSKLNQRNADHLHAWRHTLAEALRAHGHDDFLFSCSGIGGMAFNAGHMDVTEITVGAALFGLDPEDPHEVPAAGYAAEIIRRTDHDRYACLVDGHAASLASNDSLPQPYLPEGARLDTLRGAGEAQLPICHAGALDLGDMIFLHPADTSELCERFSHLLLVQDGAIVGEAETYRA
jgi:1-acyl-sn-glycerol-3-phosphate acyltransferase